MNRRVELGGSLGWAGLWCGLLMLVFCGCIRASDVPWLKQNTWELGGFVGASYGVDESRIMGGGNLTYSALRNILPYVEVSYFPSIQRTLTRPDPISGTDTIKYDVPLADVNFGIHARVQVPHTPIVPYAVLGFGLLHELQSTQTTIQPNDTGGYYSTPSTVAASTNYATNFGGGVRIYLSESFGLRGEFKGYELTGGPLKNDLHYNRLWRATFGVFWQFGR